MLYRHSSGTKLCQEAEEVNRHNRNLSPVYKGKVYPGGTMMLVSGDQVKLQNLSPEGKIVEPKANTLRQDTYIDYSRRLSYRRAVMPNNEVVYTNAPFEYGEGFTDVKTEKYLGLNCKVVRTVVNSNTIDVWYTNDLAFRGTPQSGAVCLTDSCCV